MSGEALSESRDALAVLLVEDNSGDATLVEHHLRRGSFPGVPDEQAITHVESLDAALDAVTSSTFDLVLLDLGLPESTGVETLEQFLPEASDVPVVVLTGLDNKETAVRAIQQGAQDYLPKGDLGPDVLMRSMRYAIERHKQERALREQTEQLQFFNSILRHDVGNGMEVIRHNAQLLDEDLSGPAADRAATIRSWSDDIIDLTEKIRRMLEAVARDGEVELAPVDLTAVVRDRTEHVGTMDEAATIETSLPDDPVHVLANDMLGAVIGNLLSNAIEHNDSAEPRVTVDVTAGEETVTVAIADNGPGIPDSAKESIFGWGETDGSSEGGFGLYFVATMVDSYGGTVEVRDNDPEGAVFHITLPAV
ncbi:MULTISPECIES: hybrid sensor histidine kinase/response regulator [Salinibaculum]|uniref:hybrid sensor histidine kinase/response regulator n=1 Tax=Salinibaculum TaxID=2732368 RepID=UPI0030CC5D67